MQIFIWNEKLVYPIFRLHAEQVVYQLLWMQTCVLLAKLLNFPLYYRENMEGIFQSLGYLSVFELQIM